MWNLREYAHHPKRLADHLPWAILIAPGIVLNKDGSFQTTVRLRGPDVDSATAEELMGLRARVNNAMRRLGSRWCLHIDACRRRAADVEAVAFPNGIAQRTEDEQRTAVRQTPGFEQTQHITFTYLPPRQRVRRFSEYILAGPRRGPRNLSTFYAEQLEAFEQHVEQIANILRSTMPEVRRLDDDETASYLHDCVSERRVDIQVPDPPCYFDAYLTDTPLAGGLTPKLGRLFLKVVSVRAYMSSTTPCLLDALGELACAYRWCVRFLPMDKDVAVATLRRVRRHWFARRKGVTTLLKEFLTKTESQLPDTDSLNKAQEVTDALEIVGGDFCSFGKMTLTITTWDSDERIAEQNAQAIQQVCDSAGLVSRVEDFNAVQAWLGSLPGHAYADVRRSIMSSLSVSDLIPCASVWSGHDHCGHLDAPSLAVVHTTGSTPFRFDLYQGDVGHTLVLGPTGAGKSVLLNFIAMRFLQYAGAQVYYFDKGRSCQAMTLAMNGDFYELAPDASTVSFQPLAALDQEGELTWAQTWLADILARERVEMTPALKQDIWSSLSNLATMSMSHRTLSTLQGLVQSDNLRQALQNYTLSGPYGHLLDADQDSLQHGVWQAFEMEALMSSPALVPVLTYLFHRLEQRFGVPFVDEETGKQQPRPTLLVLDEAWLYLADSTFATKIREWLKTLRKKNVAVLFATQSLSDIADSSIATAILESCPTRIFLPNPSATERATKDLYYSFGLNDRQVRLLQEAVPKQDYYYQSPAGNRLFQLGLQPTALALCSGGSATSQAIISRILENGREGFAEAYLQALGRIHQHNGGTTTNDTES